MYLCSLVIKYNDGGGMDGWMAVAEEVGLGWVLQRHREVVVEGICTPPHFCL